MIGGKWTTFRAFAEQTADEVLNELTRERKCGTLDLPIGGGNGFHADGSDILDRLTIKIIRNSLEEDLGMETGDTHMMVSFQKRLGFESRRHEVYSAVVLTVTAYPATPI